MQHYWTMSSYLEISLPLTTAVIVLPLIAPPCFRFVLQKYEQHHRHWHALVVISIIWYFIAIIVVFYAVIPTPYLMVYFRPLYFSISYSVIGMVGLIRMVQAYKGGTGRLRWSLQMVVMILCLLADLFVPYIPWALLTYLHMFLTSSTGVRWLKQAWFWLSKKVRSQVVVQKLSGTTV